MLVGLLVPYHPFLKTPKPPLRPNISSFSPQVSKDEYYRLVEKKRQEALPGGESDVESGEPNKSLKEKYDQF